MSPTSAAVILLSLLSCLTALLGVALALRLRENARALAVGIGFSVGFMVLISVLELIPQSFVVIGAGATLGAARSRASRTRSASAPRTSLPSG